MLNPNEIASKRFDKSPMLGYKTDEVENFLDKVAREYAQLANEKNDLERKIEVLADKLEEYKRDEESLKSAVFEAQKLGSSLVRDAKAKAERIIQEANEKAHFITTDAVTKADSLLNETNKRAEEIQRGNERNLQLQQEAFERLKSEVAAFKKRMMSIYKAHIELISQLPDQVAQAAPVAAPVQAETPEAPVPVRPEPQPEIETYSPQPSVSEPAAGGEDSFPDMPVAKPTEENIPLVAKEEKPIRGFDVKEAPTRELPPVRSENRFGALKFGDNYSISEEAETAGKARRKK